MSALSLVPRSRARAVRVLAILSLVPVLLLLYGSSPRPGSDRDPAAGRHGTPSAGPRPTPTRPPIHYPTSEQTPPVYPQPADLETVVNPHPFKFINNPRLLCSRVANLTLFVFVHSQPEHFYHRSVIRRTWGNTSQYRQHVRLAFVLGVYEEQLELQHSINREAYTHGDVIQENFSDSYKNLTYKALGALKWVSRWCTHAQYVLKTDDDVAVNLFGLLRSLTPRDGSVMEPGLLMCRKWKTMQVNRRGKWAVTESEFGYSVFPPYCSGLAYILTTDVVKALFMTSLYVPYFWVDDVYVTGMLPLKLSIKQTDISAIYSTKTEKTRVSETFKSPDNKFVFEHVNVVYMDEIWRDILHAESKRVEPNKTIDFHTTRIPLAPGEFRD